MEIISFPFHSLPLPRAVLRHSVGRGRCDAFRRVGSAQLPVIFRLPSGSVPCQCSSPRPSASVTSLTGTKRRINHHPRPDVSMSPGRGLRDFITQRLTAAAVEIFTAFEQTVAQYEQEIDRQRTLLLDSWTPGGRTLRTETRPQHEGEEESSPGVQVKEEPEPPEPPEPPHVKEEPGEECSAVKLEPDAFMVTVTDGESEQSEAEADGEQRPPHSALRRFVSRRLTAAAVEIFTAVQRTVDRYEEADGRRRPGVSREPAGTGSSPPHFYDENLLDQEDTESLQVNEDEEAACSSQEAVRFVFQTDGLSETPSSELRRPHRAHEQLVSFSGRSTQSVELQSSERRPFFRASASLTSTNPGQSCARCDVCGAAFKLVSQLEKHRAVHTGEKPQPCPVCGKIFIQTRSLRNHIRNHTGEKPYTCGECGKKFGQKGHLKSHMNIHTGEKPYFCETCGKRFCQKSNLISHSRIHTGEKPYSCEICGRSFTGRGNLLVHLRTHTGEKPYPCEVCGKCFSRQDALSAHMKTHTGHKSHSVKPGSEMSE